MLKPIVVASIYNNKPMPSRMALCTSDMIDGIKALEEALAAKGAKLILSDLFRSYDMQFQAHLDYTSGKKKAFSPAPGGSMHEAGRAMDISLEAISPLSLQEFWDIAKPIGFMPIIDKPKMGASESWHFDFRGSFQKVYDYAKAHSPSWKPYQIMAALAILEQGIEVDVLKENRQGFVIQSALVRLGATFGAIDGQIGPQCQKAIKDMGYTGSSDLGAVYAFLNAKVREAFPNEYQA